MAFSLKKLKVRRGSIFSKSGETVQNLFKS
jgi:hypothetical protein